MGRWLAVLVAVAVATPALANEEPAQTWERVRLAQGLVAAQDRLQPSAGPAGAAATLGGSILDLHPFGSGFRIIGGLGTGFDGIDRNRHRPRARRQPAPTATRLSAWDIDPAAGRSAPAAPLPFLGVGYGGSLIEGSLDYAFDLGALYQGGATGRVSRRERSLVDPTTWSAGIRFDSGAEVDADPVSVEPIFGFTLRYRF